MKQVPYVLLFGLLLFCGCALSPSRGPGGQEDSVRVQDITIPAHFPAMDLDGWRGLLEQRSKANEALRKHAEQDAVSAFLYNTYVEIAQTATDLATKLSLNSIILTSGYALAVIDKSWESEGDHFLVYFDLRGVRAATQNPRPYSFKKIFEIRLTPSSGSTNMYLVEAVKTKHQTKPFLYLVQDAGAHMRVVTHELYQMESDRLKLVWRWNDEYESWTNQGGERGYSISNVDFSSLLEGNNSISVYTTSNYSQHPFKATTFVWSEECGAFLKVPVK